MECDIIDKLQTLILTVAQKKKKREKYIECYPNNVETSMSNLQGCHISAPHLDFLIYKQKKGGKRWLK